MTSKQSAAGLLIVLGISTITLIVKMSLSTHITEHNNAIVWAPALGVVAVAVLTAVAIARILDSL